MNSRRVILYVGLALAFGTGFLLLNYLTRLGSTSPGVAMRPVVIAAREIPARAKITGEMLSIESRASNQIDSDAVSDTHSVAGQVSLITIPSGSIVTRSKIVTASALSIPARLAHGLRAVSIAIDRVKGVSGLVQPGDRVDVISVSPRESNTTPKATTIMRGVLVLALGNTTETPSATPGPDNQNLTTVTLAVTPQQANLLALADVYATLRLALRSPNEPLRSFPVEPIELGSTQAIAAAPAPAPAPQPIFAMPQPSQSRDRVQPVIARARTSDSVNVEVLEGDRFVRHGDRSE